MLFGGAPPLEQGEQQIVRLRPHRWVVVRAALPLVALLLSPAAYAALDEVAPNLRLSALYSLYLALLAASLAFFALKWLLFDLLPWSQRVWILTDRRLIAQSGLLAVRRRECSLLKILETDYVSRGLVARLLQIGDVEVETLGAAGPIVLRGVAHPCRVQAQIDAQARALHDAATRQRLSETPDEVLRQLEAVVNGRPGPHTATTQVIRPVSPRAARVQQRLGLLPDEAVVAVVRRHGVVLAAGLVPLLVLALAVLAAGFVLAPAAWPVAAGLAGALGLWALWRVATYLEHEYVLTTDRLMELRGSPFVFQMRDVVQLAAVQDVLLEIPNLFERAIDAGDVIVEVAAGDDVVLHTVAHPAELQKLIFETIDDRERLAIERDDQRLVSTLSRWFKEYHTLQHGGPP